MASLSLPTTALALALALAATCGTAVGQFPLDWVPEIQTVNVVAEGGTFQLFLFGGETPLLPFDAGVRGVFVSGASGEKSGGQTDAPPTPRFSPSSFPFPLPPSLL